MREGEGSSAGTSSSAISQPHVRQKRLRRIRGRRFGVSGGNKLFAVIIRTAGEDFSPRVGMGRRQIVPISEDVDLVRCERAEKTLRQLTQERIPQSVYSLEVFEK